jgi:hypothetical protein
MCEVGKRKPPLKSSQYFVKGYYLSNWGSNTVKPLHKPKQSSDIFTHRLAKHSVFHIEKVEYLLNFSSFSEGYMIYMSKILFVFKRFRVESFVCIRRVEIFILNFSKYRVLLACACHSLYLANKELL